MFFYWPRIHTVYLEICSAVWALIKTTRILLLLGGAVTIQQGEVQAPLSASSDFTLVGNRGGNGVGLPVAACKDGSLSSLLSLFWHRWGHSYFLWCLMGVG